MPMKSTTAKITQKARRKKQQIGIQAIKKSGAVDIKAAKAKVQAKVKAAKKRGRRR